MEDQLRLVKEENVRLKRDKQVLQEELLSLRGVESSQELVEENVELQREQLRLQDLVCERDKVIKQKDSRVLRLRELVHERDKTIVALEERVKALEKLLKENEVEQLKMCGKKLDAEERVKVLERLLKESEKRMSCEVDRFKVECERKDADLVRIREERNKALGAAKMWKDSKEKLAALLKEERQCKQQQIKLMFGKQDKKLQSYDVPVDMDCGEDQGFLFGRMKCVCFFYSFDEQRFNYVKTNYFGQLKYPDLPKFV